MTLYRIKKFGGFAPKNLLREKVEKHVYNAISDLAVQAHSKLVIVALTKGPEELEVPDDLFANAVTVVNGQKALLQKLSVIDEEHYGQAYWHWRGNPSEPLTLVDLHPNVVAHRIIADEILAAIERMNATSRHQKYSKVTPLN